MKYCLLCNNEKPLIKKSHIIPEFMYRELFDDKHKIFKLAPKKYIQGNMKYSRQSSGEYEGGLLCAKCDNEVIGNYENYARIAIYGGKADVDECPYFENFSTKDGLRFTKCYRLNYKKFKLFLLSILWRASISKRKFFKDIKLEHNSEILRQMILNGDAKNKNDFPILLFTYIEEKSLPADLIAQPSMVNFHGENAFIFIISGFIYFFHLSIESIIQPFRPFVLDPANEGFIIKLPDGKGVQFLSNYFGIDFNNLKQK